MAYAIADVEATEPLPGLALAPGEEGVLVLVRVRGRPVHRAMHALPAGARLSPDDVSRLLGRSAVQALVEEAVRAELASPAEARPVSLTVAVCTHARPELLEACLARLLAVRPGEGDARRFDVLVVDNNPPDDATERVVRSLPDVRYAREPRPGLDI